MALVLWQWDQRVSEGVELLLTRKLRVGSGPGAGCRVPGLALLSCPAWLQGQGGLCPSAHRPEQAAGAVAGAAAGAPGVMLTQV